IQHGFGSMLSGLGAVVASGFSTGWVRWDRGRPRACCLGVWCPPAIPVTLPRGSDSDPGPVVGVGVTVGGLLVEQGHGCFAGEVAGGDLFGRGERVAPCGELAQVGGVLAGVAPDL